MKYYFVPLDIEALQESLLQQLQVVAIAPYATKSDAGSTYRIMANRHFSCTLMERQVEYPPVHKKQFKFLMS